MCVCVCILVNIHIYIYSSVFNVDVTAPLADPTHMEIDISVWRC